MLDYIQKGGPLMGLLLACSALFLAVFFERLFHMHRATVHVGEFLQGLAGLVRKRNYAEALLECAGTPGPAARVIRAAIVHHDRPRAELKEIVRETAQLEVPRLERYLYLLAMIAYAAPLIGLLGTVVGMLDAFTTLAAHSGYATATDLAGGVYQSLLTTAAGLAVGLPAFVGYSYLSARVDSLLHDMERAGIEILHLLDECAHVEGSIDFEPPRAETAPDER